MLLLMNVFLLCCRVPSFLTKELHVHNSMTLWALLIGMVLFAVGVLTSGHYVGDTKVSCHLDVYCPPPCVDAAFNVACVIAEKVLQHVPPCLSEGP